jgi:hypothetical protein
MDDLTYALVGLPVDHIDAIHDKALVNFNDLSHAVEGSLDHAWAGLWATLVHATHDAKSVKGHASA